MKTFRIFAGGAAVAIALAAAGCSDEPKRAERDFSKTTPSVNEKEQPGNNLPSDISPMTAHLRISDLKVGTVLAANGTVAENNNMIPPGEAIHASIAVGDVGADSKVKAVWLGPDGKRISDETKTVMAGAAFLVFDAPNTSAWAAGDYKVEIYLGDEVAASDSFNIVTKNPA
ncbi:MAG: hypothetical protein ABI639_03290 [Thermoanaerobaculia bacterium]